MSIWTHIFGIVKVDVYGSAQYEIEYKLQKVITHLPIVSGSEENMHITAVKKPGYDNVSSNTDEFNHHSNLANNGNGGLFEYQTNYFLIFSGNLRDRGFDETYRALVKCLVRLCKRICVENILIEISTEYGRRKIIKSSDDHIDYWYDLSFNEPDRLARKWKSYDKKI